MGDEYQITTLVSSSLLYELITINIKIKCIVKSNVLGNMDEICTLYFIRGIVSTPFVSSDSISLNHLH